MTRNPIRPHLIYFKPRRVEDKRDKQAARDARQHMIEADMDMSYSGDMDVGHAECD